MEISDNIFSLCESDICRLCGLSSFPGYPIYEKQDSAELTIADIINRYLQIHVSFDDEHPRKICSNCKCQLDMMVKFIHDVSDGQDFFKNIYKIYKSKQFSSAELHTPENDKINVKNNIVIANNGSDMFVCETCGLTFANKHNLRIHLFNYHVVEQSSNTEITRFSCKYCKKTFAHKSGLNTHLKTHKGVKNYGCKVCKKKYYQNGNLQEHMRIHTGEKPFKCENCSVTFRTSSQLKTHMRCHSGEKPYRCSLCGKSFPHHHTLKNHLKRHYNDRQYSCEFCSKEFIDRTALVRHLRIHTGEKPYTCDICKKEFTAGTNLNKHKKKHLKDNNSSMWELTTKFHKGNSELEVNTLMINNEVLNADDGREDLFLPSSEVKDLNVDMPSNSDNNLDDLLNVNSSFTSLNSISFSESILELDDKLEIDRP